MTDFIKVTSIEINGFWIKGAKAEDMFKVEGDIEHMRWDELDIDLAESYFREASAIIRPVTNNKDSK